MHYKCYICGEDRFEYSIKTHPCPSCGNTKLLFEHIGFFGHPNHWVLIDVTTNEMIGEDLCDYLPEKLYG